MTYHTHCHQPVPHGLRRKPTAFRPRCSTEVRNADVRQAPWNLTFDLRERETEWTEANKARLIAIIAAQQLDISMSDMEQRLDSLMLLLPDLAGRLSSIQPAMVAALVQHLSLLPARLIAMKELFPCTNISVMVMQRPQLLLQTSEALASAAERLKQLLHLNDIDRLVEATPLLLSVECVEEVLLDMRRLLPAGTDVAAMLVADPSWLLRVQKGQRWLGEHPDSDPGELIS
eukprot:jgi/Chrzof1/6800/Cz19g10070.t1